MHPDLQPPPKPYETPPPLTEKQREDLHKYAYDERDEFAKLMKEGGAYCGAPDGFADLDTCDLWTGVSIAARYGHHKVVQVLLYAPRHQGGACPAPPRCPPAAPPHITTTAGSA